VSRCGIPLHCRLPTRAGTGWQPREDTGCGLGTQSQSIPTADWWGWEPVATSVHTVRIANTEILLNRRRTSASPVIAYWSS
jgi:hypothetical protein